MTQRITFSRIKSVRKITTSTLREYRQVTLNEVVEIKEEGEDQEEIEQVEEEAEVEVNHTNNLPCLNIKVVTTSGPMEETRAVVRIKATI